MGWKGRWPSCEKEEEEDDDDDAGFEASCWWNRDTLACSLPAHDRDLKRQEEMEVVAVVVGEGVVR